MHSPSNFWEWLSSNNSGWGQQADLFITVMLTIATVLILMVSIVSITVYKVHRNRLNDALKRDLLDRGMPAEDIVEIVRATPTKRCQRREY